MASSLIIKNTPGNMEFYFYLNSSTYIGYKAQNNEKIMNISKQNNITSDTDLHIFKFNKTCEIKHVKKNNMFSIYVNNICISICEYNNNSNDYTLINDHIVDDNLMIINMSSEFSLLKNIISNYDELDSLFD